MKNDLLKKLLKTLKEYYQVYILKVPIGGDVYKEMLKREKTHNLKRFPFLSNIITKYNLEPFTLLRFSKKIPDRMLDTTCHSGYSDIIVDYYVVSKDSTITVLKKGKPLTLPVSLEKSAEPIMAEQIAEIKNPKYLVYYVKHETETPTGCIMIYKI